MMTLENEIQLYYKNNTLIEYSKYEDFRKSWEPYINKQIKL